MSSLNSVGEIDRPDYSVVVNEAVEILQQSGYVNAAADIDGVVTYDQHEEAEPNSDYGMTREIMGPDYGDNLSASRVDFDQWMENHATLDEESLCSADDSDENHDEYSSDMEDHTTQDINGAWAMARSNWSVDVSGTETQLNPGGQPNDGNDEDDDAPISIGSSDSENDYGDEHDYNDDDDDGHGYGYDGGMMGENGYYFDEATDAHELGAMASSATSFAPFTSLPDQYQQLPSGTIPNSSNGVSAADQEAVANAMLFLTNNVHGPIPQPTDAVGGLPLPVLPTSGPTRSLSAMHDAINCSIDRSLALVDEIEGSCEGEDPMIEEPEQRSDKPDTEDTLSIIKRTRAESLVEQNKLNAQLVKLNTELFQLETEKSELANRVSELECENDEQAQIIDELRQQLSSKSAADEASITELKDRIKSVAAKAASLLQDLDSANTSLADTRQAFRIVSDERTVLTKKCTTLEGEIQSLSLRLENELQAHTSTRDGLRLARNGNASEMRRLELEDLSAQLEHQCSGLKEQLSASHEKERLLLNSNRALEARLRDVLRMAEQPVTPEDILADHRRAWDAQLIAARASAKEAHEKLSDCEASLQAERLANTQLREKLREMEASQSSLDQSAKKRKFEAETSENRWSIDSNKARSNAIHSVVTPTRPETTEAKRQLLEESHGRFRQAVVDAGEYARDRRRRNVPHLNILPLTPRSSDMANYPNSSQQQAYMDKPVTPRINLHHGQSDHQQSPHQKQYDIASLISPFQKSAR